ncbi:MAG: hypothetical protein ACKVZH_24900 [Blastocatellia bacterium]
MSYQATAQTTMPTDRWEKLRERFLRDPLPVRLGELSSGLSGVKYIADQTASEKIAIFFLKEPELYLEWGFPDADSALQVELAEIRQLIAQLRENWQSVWESPAERVAVGASFEEWSQKMLDRSGLLTYPDWREVFRPAPAASANSVAAKAA